MTYLRAPDTIQASSPQDRRLPVSVLQACKVQFALVFRSKGSCRSSTMKKAHKIQKLFDSPVFFADLCTDVGLQISYWYKHFLGLSHFL
jgi:hypothetical protein